MIVRAFVVGNRRDALTNLFEQDRLKTSYGKSLEGKSTPKGSFQRPRLVRKGSEESAEDGPGAVQVKRKSPFSLCRKRPLARQAVW